MEPILANADLIVAEASRVAAGKVLYADQYDDLWLIKDQFNLIVIAKPRTARDLYRTLVYADPLLASGGVILLLPYTPPDGGAGENRFEATEIFLGVHSNYERRPLLAGVVELKKRKTVRDACSNTQSQVKAIAFKKVISLAVFGTGGYWQYLGAYVRAHHTLFPKYELRIHHDENIDHVPYGRALQRMVEQGLVTLVFMSSRLNQGKCERMLHRLAPAWDSDVEYVFARDLDALPTWRERCATEEFISSGFDASTICDNIAHAGLMGGLCGFRAERLCKVAATFTDFITAAGFADERWAKHGADQDYLNASVAPKLSVLEHSVFTYIDEQGQRFRRVTPTVPEAKLLYEIRPFDDPLVMDIVRNESNTLINYMGTAGYDIARAIDFYNKYCPVIEIIKAIEADLGL